MRYYAAVWQFGRGVSWSSPHGGSSLAVDFRAFASRHERDAYVDEGPSYTTEGGYREAVTASDATLRRHQRQDLREGVSDSHNARVVLLSRQEQDDAGPARWVRADEVA
jgi:hypothetical protein